MKNKKKLRQKPKTNILTDHFGNQIVINNYDKCISLFVKLISERYKRKVGDVIKSTRVLKVYRSRYKHLHRKSGSYGFNHQILVEAKKFDIIRLNDEHGSYNIPRTFILENGSFLHFQKQGFERQIFLPVDKIESFEVKTQETEAKF